jgi:hypothetical protein
MSALLEQQLKHGFDWSRKELYKKGLTKWIKESRFDYFVTFTFRDTGIKKTSACSALRLFNIRVNRSLFGNRAKQQLFMIPFIEKNAFEGLHFHIFMKIPTDFQVDTIKDQMKRNWCLLKESGKATFSARDENDNHKWFSPIYDVEGLSKYVTKQSNNLEIDNLVADLISKH